ncbi:hypothetical protein ACFL3I_13400, partial [Pseudomonadota bacterium]
IGFTNIDDVGQEGLELAYDSWLAGSPGSKRVIKDRKGQTVEEVELIKESDPGQDLHLSIDKRLQYLAYRELKSTVLQHGARSGSVVAKCWRWSISHPTTPTIPGTIPMACATAQLRM